MTKSATIHTRIEPALKAKAEKILAKLGLSASEAISMFYSQIALNKGIPFEPKLPNAQLRKSMQDITRKHNLTHADDIDDLMHKLGVHK